MAAVIAAARRGAVRAAWESPLLRGLAKAAAGLGILVAIILNAGAEPFARGLASVSLPAVVAAVTLGAAATTAAAWRWRIIASRLELELGWSTAVSAYYRSQFLNSALPGGVVGDVHRAVSHGHSLSRIAQASRAVALERSAGQVVQFALAAVVLVSLGMSVYAPAVGVALVVIVVACAGMLVAAAASRNARAAIRREAAMLRQALGTARAAATVVAASVVVVGCHVATFIVACVAVGVAASPQLLVGVAVVAMTAAAIPLNIAGWGPREGAAAWAFAAVGLGSATGIAASTAFGVLAMIAVAPGAIVIAASALRGRRDRAPIAGQAISS